MFVPIDKVIKRRITMPIISYLYRPGFAYHVDPEHQCTFQPDGYGLRVSSLLFSGLFLGSVVQSSSRVLSLTSLVQDQRALLGRVLATGRGTLTSLT